LETDANRAQAFAAASRARLELQTAETELAEAQRNGKATDDTLARIQPQVAVLGITLAPSAEAVATQVVATAAPQAATSTEPEDMVTGIGQFAATYWIYFLAVAVILIWFFSRALGR
jgi:hypothetical protein